MLSDIDIGIEKYVHAIGIWYESERLAWLWNVVHVN